MSSGTATETTIVVKEEPNLSDHSLPMEVILGITVMVVFVVVLAICCSIRRARDPSKRMGLETAQMIKEVKERERKEKEKADAAAIRSTVIDFEKK